MSTYLRALRRRSAVVAVAVTAAASGLAAGLASTADARQDASVYRAADVAGHSPFAGQQCNVATPYYTSPGGKEGEPFVAVNPKNPHNRIAAWMDGARATVDTAYTLNKGRSWTLSIPQGVDDCTGNHEQAWEASGDPWLSIGPDGTAYLSALTWAHFVTGPLSDYTSLVHVQTSRDGGRTWSDPVYLAGHHAVSDKPMVVADPYRPGVAYEIWRNQSFGLPVGDRGKTRLLFASTRDAGRTWGDPIVIERGSDADFFGSPQLSVLRNGTLVATSSLANASGGTDLLSWRSKTGGSGWSGPTAIRRLPDGENPLFCGQAAAGGDTGGSAGQQTTLRGRSVVFAYQDPTAADAGRGKLVLARSDDAGRTWRTHPVVRSDEPLMLASVAADRRGRLALIWDQVDTSAIDCDSSTVPTRTLFKASAAGGRDWGAPVTIGNRWWNLASGARGTGGFSGYFIGDYQAVAAMPGGFTTVSVQGDPLTAAAHPTITGATGVVVANVYLNR
jgi:hypothetical protein